MTANSEHRIVSLLRAMQANSEDVITPRTRLREDLQMDGDDAVAFLEVLADEFGLDLSSLEFSQFFNDEGHVFWSPAGMIGRFLGYHQEPKGSITVAHLMSVVNLGRWFDPEALPN